MAHMIPLDQFSLAFRGDETAKMLRMISVDHYIPLWLPVINSRGKQPAVELAKMTRSTFLSVN
jgi:hypothetical protein